MALLSFVESAPRAYRLKVGNADLFRNSTEPGTSPTGMVRSVKEDKSSIPTRWIVLVVPKQGIAA